MSADERRAAVVGTTAAAEGIARLLGERGWSITTVDPAGGTGLGPAARQAVPDTVVLAHLDPASWQAAPITSLSTEAWDAAGERSIRDALVVLQDVHATVADGARVVVVLPSVATIGVPGLVPMCTAVESIRVMAKVTARRWGSRGITVNVVLVPLDAYLGARTPQDAAVPSLGTASLPDRDALEDAVALVALLSDPDGGALTGATLGADAGTVMVP